MTRRIFIVHGSHYLTDHHYNGDGLVAWGFISGLASRGHRLHVLTDRCDVRGPIPKNLTIVEIPLRGKRSLAHYLSYVRDVRAHFDRIVRSEGVDVAHQMNPVVRGLSLSLAGARVPVVLGTYVGDWASHRFGEDFPTPSLGCRMMDGARFAIDFVQQRFATRLALATPHALRRVPFRAAEPIVRYLHHGVDANLFTPVPAPGDPERRECSIVYLGSFYRAKGALDLVEAFGHVARRLPRARIVFVGDGEERERMQRRLRELGLDARAEFPGRVGRAEAAGWLRACSVLCAPSYGEPYGQNILEAMACAKPVVITTAGGHQYLSNDAGKIAVAPGDVAGLADALVRVLSDDEVASAMGRVNRSIVDEVHAWPHAVERLEAIYEEAIANA